MRDSSERIRDILDAIENIERYTSLGREAFDSDELIRVWVIHHLQIIGEAAARVDDVVRQSMAHLPWRQMIAMRNLLVHAYFGIDDEEVWQVATRHLPEIKKAFREFLDH